MGSGCEHATASVEPSTLDELEKIVVRFEGLDDGFEVLAGGSCTVGRGDAADKQIAFDLTLSRTHFAIRCYRHWATVEDLASTNGVLINGERLVVEKRLRDSDTLFAGSLRMKIQIQKRGNTENGS